MLAIPASVSETNGCRARYGSIESWLGQKTGGACHRLRNLKTDGILEPLRVQVDRHAALQVHTVPTITVVGMYFNLFDTVPVTVDVRSGERSGVRHVTNVSWRVLVDVVDFSIDDALHARRWLLGFSKVVPLSMLIVAINDAQRARCKRSSRRGEHDPMHNAVRVRPARKA